MCDGEDGAGHVPGYPQQGVDEDGEAQDQQVQVVATPLTQLVLLPGQHRRFPGHALQAVPRCTGQR